MQLTLTRARSTTSLSVKAPDRTGRGAVATARVATSPSGVAVGRLTLVLRRGEAVVRRSTVSVPSSGRVTWRLPRLRDGRWSVQAVVGQSAVATGSTAVRSLTVR